MADRRAQYEELLKRTASASQMSGWLDATAGGAKGSTHEGNLWASARMLGAALSHFLNHLVVEMVKSLDRDQAAEESQAALDLVPTDRAANAADLRLVVAGFFGAQGLEDDDTGKRRTPVETPQAQAPAVDPDAGKKPRKKREKKAAAASEPGPLPPIEVLDPLGSPIPQPIGDSSEAGMIVSGLVAIGRFPPNRAIPIDVVRCWSAEDRSAVLAYIADQNAGGEAPPPEILSQRFIEDLDLGDEHGQNEVLTNAGVAFAAAIALDSQEDFDRLMAWAIARVRHLRGEAVAVPEFPEDILLPNGAEFMRQLHAAILGGGTDGMPQAIIEERFEPDPGFRIALDLLIGAGEVLVADGRLIAAEQTIQTPIETLLESARELGGIMPLEVDLLAAEADRLAAEVAEANAATSIGNAEVGSDVHADDEESSEEELERKREEIRQGGAAGEPEA